MGSHSPLINPRVVLEPAIRELLEEARGSDAAHSSGQVRGEGIAHDFVLSLKLKWSFFFVCLRSLK